MPLLGGLLVSLFTSVVGFLTIWFTKQVAIRLAIIAALIVFTTAFITAINSTITAIQQAVPSAIVVGASWVMPSNVNECIGAYFAALALRWVYDWNTKITMMKAV